MNALAAVLLPSNLAMLLFLAGVVALVSRSARYLSRPLLLASGLVGFIFSNGLVATLLLSPLEYEYPPMLDPSRHPEVRTIVVLTAYASDDPDMPLSSRMNASAAFRVLESANLVARRPDCRVIVTGGGANARVMAGQLRQLGIPAERLEIETESPTTAASAIHLSAKLSGQSVFLVTSAGHMRRAVGVFQRQGIRPIPVPADHQLPRRLSAAEWTPGTFHLQASDLAVHEYLGLAWYRLTDRI